MKNKKKPSVWVSRCPERTVTDEMIKTYPKLVTEGVTETYPLSHDKLFDYDLLVAAKQTIIQFGVLEPVKNDNA